MKLSALFLSFLMSVNVMADEGPYLYPPYPEQHAPHVFTQQEIREMEAFDEPFEKVDHLQTALMQTPVKSQGRRGTCSIFSSTAILEYNLKLLGLEAGDPDLSEQWLEYITAAQRGSEGSWSYYNFDQYGVYGYLKESDWQYNGGTWYPYNEDYWEFSATPVEKALFEMSCKDLKGTGFFDGCLIGQMNPGFLNLDDQTLLERNAQFLEWKNKAKTLLETLKLTITSDFVYSNADVQADLDRGEVLALDVTFFYEAWNHGRGRSMEGLTIDSNLWAQGIVSYPDSRSMDYLKSQESDVRAGHSIVVVGYDPEIVISRQVQDQQGNMITVESKGVYYFKNSWGPDSFGVDFTLKGESLPGFGMIAMDYAHEFGSFYKMIIEKAE